MDVFIVIDKNGFSYEAILGIYDTFEKAMDSNAWKEYNNTPDTNGVGDTLFIYKEKVNKEICPIKPKFV